MKHTWDSEAVDHYYSGQGVVLMGLRDADGNPMGLYPVGNVSALKISIATTTLEHKESHTGQRGTDLRLTTEIKVNAAITMENYIAKNLAQALRGLYTEVAGATVTAQAFLGYCYPGAVTALGKISVSSFALKKGATALTAYVDELTAWDYKLNPDAGSVFINDGSSQAIDKLGTAITGVAVGATTVFTCANTAAVGDRVYIKGLAGADAAQFNNTWQTISAANSTTFTVAVDTTGDTITFATAFAFFPASPLTLTWDGTYAKQYLIDGLADSAKDVFVRFEGLNTAENNNPVAIEIFRMSTDPLKDLDLISDGIQQFVLEGSVLADNTRDTGSKYFKVQKLN